MKPPAWIQQALADVRAAAKMHPAHPTGLIERGEGPFQTLSAESQQAPAARARNAPTIAVHRVAGRRVRLPVPPAISSIPSPSGRTASTCSARFNQPLEARLCVAVIGILHRQADDCLSLEIDAMLDFCEPSASAHPSSS